MTRSRPQNSILAVATLGVYLGLILVGGSTTALSQRSLASIDLKMPPEGRAAVNDGLRIYIEDVEYFLTALAKLQARGKFDTSKDTFDLIQVSLQPCVNESFGGDYSPIKLATSNDSVRPALDWFSRGMQYGYSLGDCLKSDPSKQGVVKTFFQTALDRSAFLANVAVRKQAEVDATSLCGYLNAGIGLYAREPNSPVRQAILANTHFRTADGKVFIVTRLPRGSLDALIAEKAK